MRLPFDFDSVLIRPPFDSHLMQFYSTKTSCVVDHLHFTR